MNESPEPILTQLIKQGIDIDSIEKPGGYYEQLIDIIKKSSVICEMAKQPWEFKSLAQYGIERFCQSPLYTWHEPNPDWRSIKGDLSIQGAMREFSECICAWIPWLDHGLRLFVREGSNYRMATMEDEDYKFLIRLNKEDHGIFDLRFRSAPQWAHNLHLNSRALEIYEWFYSDFNGHDPRIINARKEAIERMLDEEIDGSVEKNAKPESTRKTENLLRALTCIAIDAYGYDPKSAKNTAAKDIAIAMSANGFDKDERTIRDWLKDGVDLLPTTSNKV
jgi:hypothetical protein